MLKPKICVGSCLNPVTVGNSSIQSIRVCEPYLPLFVTVIVVFRQGLIISRYVFIYIYTYISVFFI